MRKIALFSLVAFPLLLAGCTLPSFFGKTSLETGQSVTTEPTGTRASPPASPGKATRPLVVTGQISLNITSPVDGTTVNSPTITVSGRTVPMAEVMINDKELRADAKGNFSASITLDEGENTIIVVANDTEGNSSEKEITVTYNPANG